MIFRDRKEIEEKIEQAEKIKIKEENQNMANYNFADGVIAALDWVTQEGDDPFMDF